MDQVAPVSNMYRGMLKVSTLEYVQTQLGHLPANAFIVFLLMLVQELYNRAKVNTDIQVLIACL